jgi:hypothetical protein
VTPLETYTLRLGDDCLVLGQRLSEWAARAPSLEEDVALLNISLDLIGTARSLLSSVGDEDELAFGRDELSFSNAQLMELDNGDFGRTMVRQLLVSAYQVPLWEALSSSADPLLAGVAGKAVKEAAYHVDVGGAARRRDGGVAPTDAAGPRRGLALRLRAVRDRPGRGRACPAGDRRRPGCCPGGVVTGCRAGARGGHVGGAVDRLAAYRWSCRPAHRDVRLPARRQAAPASVPPGRDVVTVTLW